MARLAERIAGADLVITGEGHLDPPSFEGKVPGGVLTMTGGRCPVLCIVGDADPSFLLTPPTGLEVVSLVDRFGETRAWGETVALIATVGAEVLHRSCR
jgi:glycerate kinase